MSFFSFPFCFPAGLPPFCCYCFFYFLKQTCQHRLLRTVLTCAHIFTNSFRYLVQHGPTTQTVACANSNYKGRTDRRCVIPAFPFVVRINYLISLRETTETLKGASRCPTPLFLLDNQPNPNQTRPRKNADVTGGPLTRALLLLGARSAPLSQAQEHKNALNLSPRAAARFSPTSAGRDRQTHDQLDLARPDPSLKGTTCSFV